MLSVEVLCGTCYRLRSNVSRRATLGVVRITEAKVSNAWLSAAVNQNIERFKVAMGEVFGMQERQTLQESLINTSSDPEFLQIASVYHPLQVGTV